MTKWALYQECKVFLVPETNRIKTKSHMAILMDAEKALGNIKCPFMTKALNKPGM